MSDATGTTVITSGEAAADVKPGEAAADVKPGEAAADAKPGEAAADAKPGEAAADAKPGEKEGAPAEYESFALPDGMEVDQEALAAFAPVAKELNLTQKQAQQLIDIQVAGVERATKAQQVDWASVQDEWRDATKADKEIGRDAYGESAALAKLALDEVGTPALAQALVTTGTGNHVEFVRFFERIGRLIKNDSISFGKGLGDQPQDAAKIMYPDMK